LLKRFRDQGLTYRQLDTVFQAIVVSRILYALSDLGPFLNKELTGRINAFFKRTYRCGFTTKIMEVTSLFDNASKDLFCNMQKAHRCLFSILPVLLRMYMNMNYGNAVITLCYLRVIVIFSRRHFLTDFCLV